MIADLQPVKGTQAELVQLASTVFTAISELERQKQATANAMTMSLVGSVLPKQLRNEWETLTQSNPKVLDVHEWIKFVRTKAVIAGRGQKAVTLHHLPEAKKTTRPPVKHLKGVAHVAAPQPSQQPASQPQVSQPSSIPYSVTSKFKGGFRQDRGQNTPLVSTNALCALINTVFTCSIFDAMSVSQRKEHVMKYSLCSKCLKPAHTPADCRSGYKCRLCKGQHNTLIHTDGPSASVLVASGSTTQAAPPTSGPQEQGILLMTCQPVVTGPTGKSIRVRALLDSGSTVSLVTSSVAKQLSLQRLDKTMDISALGDVVTAAACPLTTLTLSSLHTPGWNLEMTAVITGKISGHIPLQGASSVRKLPHIKGRTLADPEFDQPGRIDMLLGEDVLADILLTGGPKGTVALTESVFGGAIRGPYVPDKLDSPQPAAVHLVICDSVVQPDRDTTAALTSFWEAEEPSKPSSTFSPEENKVQLHYLKTHTFIPSAGKYRVSLPRKEQDLSLGESRSQAVKRFHSHERSLAQKGHSEKFHQQIQEYLDLGHTQLVTKDELHTPVGDCYYLPMHGVGKESSSTTKYRIVFDASA